MSTSQTILMRPESLERRLVSVTATERGVSRLELGVRRPRRPADAHGGAAARRWLQLLRPELEAYFRGEPVRFTVPLDLEGQGTSFQLRVWRALEAVPHGVTCTYGELAARVGCPGGARAVGQAVGRNPVPILVPCHRVVGHGGRLGGFSAGLDFKVFLLGLERCPAVAPCFCGPGKTAGETLS